MTPKFEEPRQPARRLFTVAAEVDERPARVRAIDKPRLQPCIRAIDRDLVRFEALLIGGTPRPMNSSESCATQSRPRSPA
ncbi:MAG: hypothetical protein CMQ24_06265 [Gammaproteobacteria bacterium]|nr:hypothetical protein [Gammaproteobacteria bacterium]